MRFGQTDQEFLGSLDPRRTAVIVVAEEEKEMDRLTIAQEMVVDFLNKYDQAIENLELGLIYGYQDDLRRYALAQRSLEFFRQPETIEEFNAYLTNLLMQSMDQDPSARAEEISETISFIQENYNEGHYSLNFLIDMRAQTLEASQQN